MIKKIVWFALILLISLFTTRVYFNERFPYTHDGENHLARFANYKIAFKEGQIPPRFAPNLVNHYGYPVFNYNYPLANISSLPFSMLKINYEITFKIIVISFVLIGMIGIIKWLDKLYFSKKSQIFSIVAFGLSPFLANLIYFRGNIGEIMALCILPWLLYFVEIFRKIINKDDKNKSQNINILLFTASSFTWMIFLLSHNITALFGTVFVLLYFIIRNWNNIVAKNNIKSIFTYLASLGTGILLSLWFWIPAIAEKNEIILDNSSSFDEYIRHFPTLSQLLFSPLEFGFSFISNIDTMSFSLGLVQIISLVITIIILIKTKIIFKNTKFNEQQKLIVSMIVITILTIIFQLSITQPIWNLSIIGKYIQFPWRLSLFFTIAVLPIIAYLFDYLSNKGRFLMIAIIIIQAVNISKIKPADFFHRLNRDYDAFTQSTSTLNENLPKTFTLTEIGEWQPTAEVLEGNAGIAVRNWNGSSRNYTIISSPSENLLIVEPTMNFLGWETTVNGEKVEYINNDLIQGRIAYRIITDNRNPNETDNTYLIKTKFTQKTPARIIGNTVSFITLTVISFYLVKHLFSYFLEKSNKLKETTNTLKVTKKKKSKK